MNRKASARGHSSAAPIRLNIWQDRPVKNPVSGTACLVTGASLLRQRIIGPAQYLQKIPEVLQTSLPATAQAPFTVPIATPVIDSPCPFPPDSPTTDGGCATARRSHRRHSLPN